MRMMTTTTTSPILHPHPHPIIPLLCLLPTPVNCLAPHVPSGPLVLGIAIPQWKPRLLLRKRENRPPNKFPAARMMKSLSPRSDGRPLVWRVTSVGNARSLVGNPQKAVSTGLASESTSPPPPFLFSDWFASFLVSASPEGWNVIIQPSLAVGLVAVRLLSHKHDHRMLLL